MHNLGIVLLRASGSRGRSCNYKLPLSSLLYCVDGQHSLVLIGTYFFSTCGLAASLVFLSNMFTGVGGEGAFKSSCDTQFAFLYKLGPPAKGGTTHSALGPTISISNQGNASIDMLIGQTDGGDSELSFPLPRCIKLTMDANCDS